jgi:CspA family cold shock protein
MLFIYIRMTEAESLPNTTTSEDTRYAGRVKWFNNKAGYGFISSTKDGENTDVFVHHSALSTTVDQFRYLMEGEYVEFSLSPVNSDDEKVSAVDVIILIPLKLTLILPRLVVILVRVVVHEELEWLFQVRMVMEQNGNLFVVVLQGLQQRLNRFLLLLFRHR